MKKTELFRGSQQLLKLLNCALTHVTDACYVIFCPPIRCRRTSESLVSNTVYDAVRPIHKSLIVSTSTVHFLSSFASFSHFSSCFVSTCIHVSSFYPVQLIAVPTCWGIPYIDRKVPLDRSTRELVPL